MYLLTSCVFLTSFVKEPMDEDVVKEANEEDPVADAGIEEDAVEKDDDEIPMVSITMFVCSLSLNKCVVLTKIVFLFQDSPNNLTDLNYFSSLPDDMVCNLSYGII